MTDKTPTSGFAHPPFEPVRAAFEQNFAEDLEDGAHFAVIANGETVVSLYGGYTDRRREAAWEAGRIAGIFSCGKAVLAMLVARAVSDGNLAYDTPVADIWPAFSGGGKDALTIADVLSHQAGLVGFPDEASPTIWIDRNAVCARIELLAPLFEPGTASGYSPQIGGFIIDEVLRRVSGASVREQLSELGLDLFCGMTPGEIERAVGMRKPPQPPFLGELTDLKRVAFLKPWSSAAKVSREEWMAAEIPAANMHADAVALASIVQPLANAGRWLNGERMIDAGIVEECLAERIRGDDLVLPFNLSWSAGVMRNIKGHFGPSASAYGHAGSGGSCVMFDPANGLSAAYVMNRMSPHLVGDPRPLRLLNAVYAAL